MRLKEVKRSSYYEDYCENNGNERARAGRKWYHRVSYVFLRKQPSPPSEKNTSTLTIKKKETKWSNKSSKYSLSSTLRFGFLPLCHSIHKFAFINIERQTGGVSVQRTANFLFHLRSIKSWIVQQFNRRIGMIEFMYGYYYMCVVYHSPSVRLTVKRKGHFSKGS